MSWSTSPLTCPALLQQAWYFITPGDAVQCSLQPLIALQRLLSPLSSVGSWFTSSCSRRSPPGAVEVHLWRNFPSESRLWLMLTLEQHNPTYSRPVAGRWCCWPSVDTRVSYRDSITISARLMVSPGGWGRGGNMHLPCQLEVRTHMSQTWVPVHTQINLDTS